MVDKEMSPPWKLILPKTRFKILAISFVILAIGFGFSFVVVDSCPVKHMILLEQIKEYEDSFDPDLCLSIMNRIDFFNESCEPKLEIIDCG